MNKSPKLMIVDNEIDICNFVKSFFEVRGFEVSTALDGEEAVSKLLSVRPDVMLLDVMMRTDREGLDYLPQIKKMFPTVKVLMVTGVEDREVVEAAKKLGADDYITKPLVLEYLETTVLEKINKLKAASVQ